MSKIFVASQNSPTLEEVHLRFIEWRQTRHNQELILYALRMDVASLLDQYPSTIITQTLSLTNGQLKDIRALKKYRDAPSTPSVAAQTFVQMPSLTTIPSSPSPSTPVETDASYSSGQTPVTPVDASMPLMTLTLTNQHNLTFQMSINQAQALLFLKTFINESTPPCSN